MKLLQGILGLYAQRADWFAGLLLAHIGLALTAIAMSGMIGLLTGIWIAEHPRIAPPVMGVCNVLYTIPAISLLGILIPFSGIGNKTAVIALTVYGIMPMVHNTYVGLTTLDPDILEAARGMGSTGTQALFRVKLPMAAGVILAGVPEHGGHDHLRGWHCLLCGGRWPGRGRLPGNHHLRSGHDGGGQHPDRPAGHCLRSDAGRAGALFQKERKLNL